MGNKPRTPMSRADRAKQFAPFSALSGLGRAIAAKERRTEERRELSEESAAELDAVLRTVRKGDLVTAVWYDTDAYTQLTGTVTRVDGVARVLLVGETGILFHDLCRLIKEDDA